MSIFPNFNPTFKDNEEIKDTFKEYALNFETGELLYKNGKAIILEGKEALKIWIWKALKTAKGRYEAYNSFGNEYENIFGKSYSKALSKSILEQLTKECLLQNNFIKDVSSFNAEIDGEKIIINAKIISEFGGIDINV